MAYDYGKQRTKLFKNLADHCHDKALDTHSPELARDWMVLMDACCWLCHPDAEVDYLDRLFKKAAS